jgi:hypothetical protein
MPAMKPVDESFFDTAPELYQHTWDIPRPADGVWSELVGDQPLYWCNGLNITWITPPPFGVDSTRTAKVLGGVLTMKEHFFIWEEGRRHAFYGEAINLPLFAKLAEDYLVTPTGESSCTFTWKIAIEPTLLGKPGAPLNKLVFGQAFKDTGKHFRAG